MSPPARKCTRGSGLSNYSVWPARCRASAASPYLLAVPFTRGIVRPCRCSEPPTPSTPGDRREGNTAPSRRRRRRRHPVAELLAAQSRISDCHVPRMAATISPGGGGGREKPLDLPAICKKQNNRSVSAHITARQRRSSGDVDCVAFLVRKGAKLHNS